MECAAVGIGSLHPVYDRFRLWEQQGVFERIWQAGLEEYDDLEGIVWEWQSLDGVMTKDPFGGSAARRQSHRSRQARNQAQSVE